jgi:type II secretion system protein C
MKTDVLVHSLKNPKLISLINILMGFVFIFSALVFIRSLLSIYTDKREVILREEEKVQPEIRLGLQDYSMIIENNPFGFSAGKLSPVNVSISESPLPKSDLFLIGTVAGRRDASYAIFTDETGRQEVFRTGDQVFGFGTLKKVDITSATINLGGRDSVIEFSDLTIVKEIRTENSPATSTTAFGRKTGPAAYQVNQRMVQEAIEKPDQILTDARFVPNVVQGRQQGFVLKEVRPGGIYQSLGLQNDDILLRINEYDISNPQAALQAFTALRGIDRAEVDIIRKGGRMTMSYQIR